MARKNRNHHFDLPPLELRCMKALWDSGQATVQEIRDILMPDRPLAYTTVMTVMDRLSRKGVVVRVKKGRAHLYSPAVGEDVIRERALNHLVDNFFEGEHDELRKYLNAGAAGNRKAMSLARPSSVKPRRAPLQSTKDQDIEARMDASLL
jgi:predicted transcriptional regulator